MKKLFLLTMMLFLHGCAHLPLDPETDARWQEQHKKLGKLSTWTLSGSVAAHTADNGWNARVFWQYQNTHYTLDLQGPLGQGALQLVGALDGVTLTTADRNAYHASTPELLLEQHTDLKLPVSYLRYWLLGMPLPDHDIDELEVNEEGYLDALQQAEWRVDYQSYQEVEGLILPKKIHIQNNIYSAKIFISNWQLSSP